MGRSGAAIGHDEARLSEEWRTSLFWVVLNLNPAIWEAIAGTGAEEWADWRRLDGVDGERKEWSVRQLF